MSGLVVVILAAGQGKRMHSALPKVLHPLLGTPMLGHVLNTALQLQPKRMVVVTGHGREAVQAYVAQWAQVNQAQAVCLEQPNPNGTGHAVLCAREGWQDAEQVLILYGDVPLLRWQTLDALLAVRQKAPLALLVAQLPDPTGYGRVALHPDGQHMLGVVEHKDASEAERQLRIVNAGMMAVSADFLANTLTQLQPNNAQGELYLTDLVALAAAQGQGGVALQVDDNMEVSGVNSRAELAALTTVLRNRVALAHLHAGVGMDDADAVWIEPTVQLAADCSLGMDVELRGNTQIEAGARIDRGCVLTDVTVAAGAHVLPYTVATEASIGAGAHVGPFAHLRPGTVLQERVKVGNFVETKKANLGPGAKASHLSYLGDADIGANCNIGAGTITCNYDGVFKYRTTLGADVFIGSDSQLVAPVTVGQGAYVGAGSTITQDVPAGALALSRTPQRAIEGWVARKQVRDDEKRKKSKD